MHGVCMVYTCTCMVHACTLHVPCVYHACTLHVPCMIPETCHVTMSTTCKFHTCNMHAYYMHSISTRHVHCVHIHVHVHVYVYIMCCTFTVHACCTVQSSPSSSLTCFCCPQHFVGFLIHFVALSFSPSFQLIIADRSVSVSKLCYVHS